MSHSLAWLQIQHRFLSLVNVSLVNGEIVINDRNSLYANIYSTYYLYRSDVWMILSNTLLIFSEGKLPAIVQFERFHRYL